MKQNQEGPPPQLALQEICLQSASYRQQPEIARLLLLPDVCRAHRQMLKALDDILIARFYDFMMKDNNEAQNEEEKENRINDQYFQYEQEASQQFEYILSFLQQGQENNPLNIAPAFLKELHIKETEIQTRYKDINRNVSHLPQTLEEDLKKMHLLLEEGKDHIAKYFERDGECGDEAEEGAEGREDAFTINSFLINEFKKIVLIIREKGFRSIIEKMKGNIMSSVKALSPHEITKYCGIQEQKESQTIQEILTICQQQIRDISHLQIPLSSEEYVERSKIQEHLQALLQEMIKNQNQLVSKFVKQKMILKLLVENVQSRQLNYYQEGSELLIKVCCFGYKIKAFNIPAKKISTQKLSLRVPINASSYNLHSRLYLAGGYHNYYPTNRFLLIVPDGSYQQLDSMQIPKQNFPLAYYEECAVFFTLGGLNRLELLGRGVFDSQGQMDFEGRPTSKNVRGSICCDERHTLLQ